MDVVLLGAQGHAKDTIKNIEEYNIDQVSKRGRFKIIGCLDDINGAKPGAELCGYPILSSMKVFDKAPFKDARVICATGDPLTKQKLVKKAAARKLKFFSLVHPSVTIHRSCKVGEGVNLFASSILSACCRIGDHVSVNYMCSINHDCIISDFVTLAPGVKIGGSCMVGPHVFLGINACVIHGITIGRWAIVGAGATVIKDVSASTVAAGNPAKAIGKRDKNIPAL